MFTLHPENQSYDLSGLGSLSNNQIEILVGKMAIDAVKLGEASRHGNSYSREEMDIMVKRITNKRLKETLKEEKNEDN